MGKLPLAAAIVGRSWAVNGSTRVWPGEPGRLMSRLRAAEVTLSVRGQNLEFGSDPTPMFNGEMDTCWELGYDASRYRDHVDVRFDFERLVVPAGRRKALAPS